MGDSIQVSGAAGEPVVPWIPTRIDRLCLEKKALRAHIPTIKGGALTALFISATAVIGTAPEQSLTALFAGAAASVAGFALTMRQAGKAQRENNRTEYFFVDHHRLYHESDAGWNSQPYHPAYDLQKQPVERRDMQFYAHDKDVDQKALKKAYEADKPYHAVASNKDPCYGDGELEYLALGRIKVELQKDSVRLQQGKKVVYAGYGYQLSAKKLQSLAETFKTIDRFYANGKDESIVLDFSQFYKKRHGSPPPPSPAPQPPAHDTPGL